MHHHFFIDKLENFFSQYPEKRFKAGSTVLSSSTTPSGVFYINKGFVRAYTISKDGEEISLYIRPQGLFFPMGWAISKTTSTKEFDAITDVTVHIAPRPDVEKFLKDNPDVLFEFSSRLVMLINNLNRQIEIASFGNAYARTIGIILYLASFYQDGDENSVQITQHFTHESISSFTRTSRERVTLEMKKLVRKKLIKIEKRIISIPNIKKLEAELEDNLR